MWIILLIFFNGPMQIERSEILETHFSEQKCLARVKEAQNIGLPKNTNIGCIFIKGVAQT